MRVGRLLWRRLALVPIAACLSVGVAGCGPKEGTPEWCEAMKDKPRGNWTVHEEEIYGDKCAANEIERQFNKLLKH
jgi:hypothetical protein